MEVLLRFLGSQRTLHVAPDELEVVANPCLLYTSDAADERSSVDLGGRRIIKKKNKRDIIAYWTNCTKQPEIEAT